MISNVDKGVASEHDDAVQRESRKEEWVTVFGMLFETFFLCLVVNCVNQQQSPVDEGFLRVAKNCMKSSRQLFTHD